MKTIHRIIICSAIAATLFSRPALATEVQNTNIYGTEEINHLGLSVSKLDETAAFFIDVLGWQKAGEKPDYPAVFVTNGSLFLTLWQVKDPATATPFNRRQNVGLHHLAITVNSLDNLHALHDKLKALPNVRIEFSPEHLGDGPTTHMMIRDPSGLRLEFIVPKKYLMP
ncbi:VOC family protein [Paremcibacter congregatus]|uniref:Glyoxalase n=1 Tax=Paremcibacter congregatus TaxID=2043170 RepID=A0A2G4YM42_9PROT|nr:VOC family protein [Paremcibacter congregatus]PHZ83395.1 glyoxalase [Paremcibacter congregatus]QDE28135.1 VOC family protein [Paremcibacter congregatus]